MEYVCSSCGNREEATLGPHGGIFRCLECRRLNLRLPKDSAGLMSLGEFQILEEVGQGANAVVCRARHRGNRVVYALKVFVIEDGDEHSVKEFLRESEVAKEIVHQNVVRVISTGEWHDIPYLVMEYVDGFDMTKYLQHYGPMDAVEAMKLGACACAALDYVWSNFLMVHRDMKPQNIMLSRDGQVKICDFGMITSHEAAEVDLEAVEGTPYYLSPECILDGAYQDNRSDIYSLGATLYHIISGDPPFNYDSLMEVLNARTSEPAPDIRKIRPDVDEGVAELIRTMMCPDPEGRYVTALECMEDMRRVYLGGKPELVDPMRRRVNT